MRRYRQLASAASPQLCSGGGWEPFACKEEKKGCEIEGFLFSSICVGMIGTNVARRRLQSFSGASIVAKTSLKKGEERR